MASRETASPEETRAFGERLGRLLQAGDVVLLSGGLGAGKTTLAQGIAQGMRIEEPVTSPTFTLIHEYSGARGRLIHFDAYRLEGPAEVESAGFSDYLRGADVVLVEWPERLGPLTPPDALRIELVPLSDDARRITVTGQRERFERLLKVVEQTG